MKTALLIASIALAAAHASAGTWAESPDAGDTLLTSNNTSGVGTLDFITGSLPLDADFDLYKINITDKNSFYAAVTNLTTNLDPDIWLFNAAGVGIGHSDIVQGGDSSVSNALIPSNGIYYVGVSNDGGEAFSIGGQMWSTGPGASRAPDGPGAALALSSWGGTPVKTITNYTIRFTGGTGYAVTTPEPSSLAAMTIAAALLRRRR